MSNRKCFKSFTEISGFIRPDVFISIMVIAAIIIAMMHAANFFLSRKNIDTLASDILEISAAFTGVTKLKFMPRPPDNFTPYTVLANASGYYICTSASVSSSDSREAKAISKAVEKLPAGKAFKNTICGATANAEPRSYPATVYLTYWLTPPPAAK